MWHYHSQERAYKDVIIQVSDDPEFIRAVTTIFNSDHDNSAKKGAGKNKAYIETNIGKLVVVNPPVKAATSACSPTENTTNDMNHYIEVEVYGR